MFIHIKDVQFIAACAPPGGGRNKVSGRLFRHFNTVWLPELNDKNMKTIFTSILEGHLTPPKKKMDKKLDYKTLSKNVVSATVDCYLKIRKELKPSPTKTHYTFNLRDLSSVV